MTNIPDLPDFPDVSDVLNRFADQVNQVLGPPPRLNRAQRRATGKPRSGRRQRELQASIRLRGNGRKRTSRQAQRR